jgi:hypothetical protein
LPNPLLTIDQLLVANTLIDEVRVKLRTLTGDDTNYHWALRRKLAKELVYDERGKTAYRVKLKALKRKEQNEICPLCQQQLPEKYCVLDRAEAVKGYTMENTRLICQTCDYKTQKERGFK